MNTYMLKGKIREHGLTQEQTAKEIGMSLSRFNAKINESVPSTFTLREMRGLHELLKLTPQEIYDIFFR